MYASTLWDPSSASNTVTPVVRTSGYELIPTIAAGARQPLFFTPRDALELHLHLTPQVPVPIPPWPGGTGALPGCATAATAAVAGGPGGGTGSPNSNGGSTVHS